MKTAPAACFVVLCVFACKSGETPATGDPAKAESKKAPAKTDEKIAAKGDAKNDANAEPAAAPAGDDWLLWHTTADGVTTRWLSVAPGSFTVVATRKAAIVGEGDRMWRLEPKSATVKVGPCNCEEQDDADELAECPPTSELRTLGVAAIELGTDKSTDLVEPSTEDLSADDAMLTLSLVGSAGAKVMIATSDSGYYCGAHGMTDARTVTFDLGGGKDVGEQVTAAGKALDVGLRKQAAEDLRKQTVDCDAVDAKTTEQILAEMELEDVEMSAKKGAPVLSWSFQSELPYVCSPDYWATATVESDLVPEAAAIGLGGPLPDGLRKAIAEIGDAGAIGFGKLSFTGDARAAALARFEAAPEIPFGPQESELAQAAPPGAGEDVKKGRAATRTGDYEGAIAAFDAAIGKDEKLAVAWSGRGFAKLKKGDLDGAKTDFEQAVKLDDSPKFAAAVRFNLGAIAEQKGDTKAAIAAYEASLKLREVKEVREALERVRSAK